MQQQHTYKQKKWIGAHLLSLMCLLALLFAACSSLTTTTSPTVTPTRVASTQTVSISTGVVPVPIKGVSTAIMPGDWPGYLLDNEHTGFNKAETVINAATASRLNLHWTYHASAAISTQPVEAYGMVYWGSWDGLEHATDLNGHEVWSVNLGTTQYKQCNPTVGVASTASVAPVTIGGITSQVVFVGGGDAHFYALNASNGQVLWKTALGSSPSHFIWSSSVVYNGSVYVGMASYGDCPLVQGQLFQMDTVTGAIQHRFDVVPNGCVGGTVWSTPTIDAGSGNLYLVTGSSAPSTCPRVEIYSYAVIELHASDLAVVGYWRVPLSKWLADGDFGATPTLFTARIQGALVGLVGVAHKNGIYYALVRGAISKGAVWTFKVARRGSDPENGEGSISPSAWDGTAVYVAGGNTRIKGVKCQGSLRALNPATGLSLWEDCLPDGPVLAPVTGVPGLVVVEEGPTFAVINAETGKVLFSYKDPKAGSLFYGAASIAHGMLYIGSTNGNLYAFGL